MRRHRLPRRRTYFPCVGSQEQILVFAFVLGSLAAFSAASGLFEEIGYLPSSSRLDDELPAAAFSSASALAAPYSSVSSVGHGKSQQGLLVQLQQQPEFDLSVGRNISIPSGRTACLYCRVTALGNKTLSWVRHRDISILSSGHDSYTADKRFKVSFNESHQLYSMCLHNASASDTGFYECQISTQPIKSMSLYMRVVDTRAEILGAPTRYVNPGSFVNLTCLVNFAQKEDLQWLHGDKVILYNSPRGGITIVTESAATTRSYLLILNVRQSDSGTYTCKPPYGKDAQVKILVLDGERPAAMQQGASTISTPFWATCCRQSTTTMVIASTTAVFLWSLVLLSWTRWLSFVSTHADDDASTSISHMSSRIDGGYTVVR